MEMTELDKSKHETDSEQEIDYRKVCCFCCEKEVKYFRSDIEMSLYALNESSIYCVNEKYSSDDNSRWCYEAIGVVFFKNDKFNLICTSCWNAHISLPNIKKKIGNNDVRITSMGFPTSDNVRKTLKIILGVIEK